jgi:hypothetical protein
LAQIRIWRPVFRHKITISGPNAPAVALFGLV